MDVAAVVHLEPTKASITSQVAMASVIAVKKVRTRFDVADVHEDLGKTVTRGEGVMKPTGMPCSVLAPVADEDAQVHANGLYALVPVSVPEWRAKHVDKMGGNAVAQAVKAQLGYPDADLPDVREALADRSRASLRPVSAGSAYPYNWWSSVQL